ncbi:MAG: Ig-like domain-containing protein, partial [Candidatus Bipolaricaulis sp.]|nr:Ig-like domain-containing protein [Candidatus Bipolaricaulis sp.]
MSVDRVRRANRKGAGRRPDGEGLSRIARRVGWAALAMVAIGLGVGVVGDDLLQVGEHVFEFRGVDYNGDGTSTWYYTVTSGRKPALSHWVLEFDPSILGMRDVVTCSERYEVSTDPTTHVYGLKFDGGYKDNEMRDVMFVLDGWYSVASVRIGVKAGKKAEIAESISGPGEVLIAENVPPIAADDAASTTENGSVQIDVLENDEDDDGTLNRTSVTITQAPDAGTADVDPTMGTVTYTPYPGECGSDSFDYTVEDDDGAVSDTARVTIVIACNQPPEAAGDFATTDEYTAVAINVVANDRDADGMLDPTGISVTREPTFGTLSVHPATGVVTYTPAVGGCGDEEFEYTVQDDDGAVSNPASVIVTVLCTDPPLAIDDLYNVEEGGTLTVSATGVLANDQETPGKPLMAALVSDVRNGLLTLNADGSFTYTHDGTETTEDAFSYIASDTSKESNVATVSLVIAPTNDAPEAADDRAETREHESITIDVLANDSDPDGDSLVVDWTGVPANGEVSNSGSSVVYAPNGHFHGTDTFTYAASDGHGGTASASVTVLVAPVNDPPLAQDDSASTNEDVAVSISVLANDSDPDGEALSIDAVTQPENGTVVEDGAGVVYTPSADVYGTETFTYTVSDGVGAKSTAVVTVVVAPVNDAPQARGGVVFTDEDAALEISVLANDSDPDGDSLILESVTEPGHATVTTSGDAATYT